MEEKPDRVRLALPAGDLWVFGYGSLMWRPGFEFVEAHTARLHGYHRALCVWSWVHRGTREAPGLVFGLDLGGACVGRALRVPEAEKKAVVDYLCEREMVTPVYRPALRRLHLPGRVVRALVFAVDRGHPQYAGRLDAQRAAVVVGRARGRSGANAEYLANTVAHLDALGVRDRRLHRVQRLVEQSVPGVAPGRDGWGAPGPSSAKHGPRPARRAPSTVAASAGRERVHGRETGFHPRQGTGTPAGGPPEPGSERSRNRCTNDEPFK